MNEWIVIPSDIAEKARRSAELARLRRARYEDNNPGRKHGTKSGTPRPKLIEREFVVWDGEGPKDTGYSLLGNSEGEEICYPNLSTLDCLRLILDSERAHPDAIHVWFGGNYDASNILRDLSWRHFAALHEYGRTVWRDYEIEHIPHKWMKIKHGKTVVKIYDVRSFFSGGLVSVLTEWKIGPWADIDETSSSSTSISSPRLPALSELKKMTELEVVTLFKKLRASFTWADIAPIRYYMHLELKYTKLLMETLRTVFNDAGYLPTSWHGPGALARMAMTRHKVYDAMAETPVDVQLAARAAFAGGRFEQFIGGHLKEKVYVADQNSAYPYFATLLPNLNRGRWRRTRNYEPGKFGVYRIRYESRPDAYRIYPLFKRESNGSVVWPYRCEGWYWAPEADLVKDDPDAHFLEGLVFDEDNPADRPFAFLTEYYRRRQLLKRLGNPAEFTFKLIINAIYGQLAQRAGWDRKKWKAPRTHQLEWAGFITSGCRAESFRAAFACGDKCISIDTDGVASLCPIPIPVERDGEELGQWKLSEYSDGIFWQSGIYALKTGRGWSTAKTRGIPKGTYSAEELIRCIETNTPLELTKKVFVTYGLAEGGQRDKLNTWQEEPHVFLFGGSGKRMHNTRVCANVCHGQIHRFGMLQVLYGPDSDSRSRPHYLPWIDVSDRAIARYKSELDDWTWYDANHLDEDDEWIRTHAAMARELPKRILATRAQPANQSSRTAHQRFGGKAR